MDDLVSAVAGEQSFVHDYSGRRIDGTYSNLSQVECAKIIAKLAGLKQWSLDCIQNSCSCGAFLMIVPGGRESITHQALCIGPIQN